MSSRRKRPRLLKQEMNDIRHIHSMYLQELNVKPVAIAMGDLMAKL